ncbi:MAG: metalloregulator ArsR/SmtB family transcription factor [Pseudolysinimonas sp.]
MHVFTLLGDPVRFRIVEVLASGSHRAGELADAVGGEFGIGRTAVAHHVRILRDAGFVAIRVDENFREYRLSWDALKSVDRVLLDLFEKWDRRYGWPYKNDPLADPPRRHRLTERTRRTPTREEIEPRNRMTREWWDWQDEEPDEEPEEEPDGEPDGEQA